MRLGTNLPGSAVRQARPPVDSSYVLTSETHTQKLSDGKNPRSVKSYGGVPRTLLARTQRCVAAVAGPRDVKRSLCTQQPRWASTPENLRHAYRNTCTRTFTAPFIHHSQNVRRPTDRGDTSQPHRDRSTIRCYDTMNLDNILPSGRSQSKRPPLRSSVCTKCSK